MSGPDEPPRRASGGWALRIAPAPEGPVGAWLDQGTGLIKLAWDPGTPLPVADGYLERITWVEPRFVADVAGLVHECVRALGPGGRLGLTDVVAWETQSGRHLDSFLHLCQPAHRACHTTWDWEALLYAAGLEIVRHQTFSARHDLDDWAEACRVPPADLIRLRVLLLQAPSYARGCLAPKPSGARVTFQLDMVVMVGAKAGRLVGPSDGGLLPIVLLFATIRLDFATRRVP